MDENRYGTYELCPIASRKDNNTNLWRLKQLWCQKWDSVVKMEPEVPKSTNFRSKLNNADPPSRLNKRQSEIRRCYGWKERNEREEKELLRGVDLGRLGEEREL